MSLVGRQRQQHGSQDYDRLTLPGPFELLRSLQLPLTDHAVFGSGPLIVRGIVPFENDLDVVCRGPAWERVAALGEFITYPDTGNRIAVLDEGRLTFGTTWFYGDPDVDRIIDRAEVIEGVPFARLDDVERFKLIADRPKDRRHLEALAGWRAAND